MQAFSRSDRTIFIVAIFCGLAGVSLWIWAALWPASLKQPTQWHTVAMIIGFAAPMIFGLSQPAQKLALTSVGPTLVCLLSTLAFSMDQAQLAYTVFTLALAWHLFILQGRGASAQSNSQPGLKWALWAWLLSAAALALGQKLHYIAGALAYDYFFHGAILALIGPIQYGRQISRIPKACQGLKSIWVPMSGALGIPITFLIEHTVDHSWGGISRALVTAIFVTLLWQLWRRPQLRPTAILSWTSGIFLIVGLCLPIAQPQWRIHALHLTLIGGISFSLLSWAESMIPEQPRRQGKGYIFAGFLVFLGATTRFYAGTSSYSYENHLAYAALVWMGGATYWWLRLVRR